MAQVLSYVATGDDDYTQHTVPAPETFDYDETTILGSASRPVNELYQNLAIIEVDTTNVPSNAIITSAMLVFYVQSYVVSPKGLAASNLIHIWDNVSDWQSVMSYSSTSTGWQYKSLPAGVLQYINRSGKTKFKLWANSPGIGQSRSWAIRAYEYPDFHMYRAYLTVNYNLPGRSLIVNCG